MDKEIVGNLISALGGILAAAVPLLFKNRSLKRRLDEPVAVARSLAVGYFYNFLHKIGSQLGASGLDVQLDPKNPARRQFSQAEVTITFVVPKSLSKGAAQQVEKEAGRHPLGLIHFPLPDRPRPVNYSIEVAAGGATSLTIIDPVRPCFAIGDYLAYHLKIDANSEYWRSLEAATLSEFKRTIEDLRKKDREGAFIARVAWQEVE
jgi:hypothetical protein